MSGKLLVMSFAAGHKLSGDLPFEFEVAGFGGSRKLVGWFNKTSWLFSKEAAIFAKHCWWEPWLRGKAWFVEQNALSMTLLEIGYNLCARFDVNAL